MKDNERISSEKILEKLQRTRGRKIWRRLLTFVLCAVILVSAIALGVIGILLFIFTQGLPRGFQPAFPNYEKNNYHR